MTPPSMPSTATASMSFDASIPPSSPAPSRRLHYSRPRRNLVPPSAASSSSSLTLPLSYINNTAHHANMKHSVVKPPASPVPVLLPLQSSLHHHSSSAILVPKSLRHLKPNVRLITSAAATVVLCTIFMLFQSASVLPPATATFALHPLPHHVEQQHDLLVSKSTSKIKIENNKIENNKIENNKIENNKIENNKIENNKNKNKNNNKDNDNNNYNYNNNLKYLNSVQQKHHPHHHRSNHQFQNNPNLTKLVSSDGSHFLVDLTQQSSSTNSQQPFNFDIRHVGTRSDLSIHDLKTTTSSNFASIAFFIQISSGNVAMLPRLLVNLWHPNHTLLLHLDTKMDDKVIRQIHDVIRANAAFDENVYFLPSDDVTYKGVSMLLNTIAAMEFFVELDRAWTYFINLSGSDYPLVNAEIMGRLLGEEDILNRNMSFMQIAPNKQFWNHLKHSRFDYLYFDTALAKSTDTNRQLDDINNDEDEEFKQKQLLKQQQQQITNSNTNPNTNLIHTWLHHPLEHVLPNFEFIQAEAWIIAHKTFVEQAVHSRASRKLLLFLSLMQDPEEHFFPMLAWNHRQLNLSLAHHGFRAVFWEFDGKMAGQHPYYVDTFNSTLNDFPFWNKYIKTSPCFFVRKVSQPKSPLLDRIDKLMSGTHLYPDVSSISKSLQSVSKFFHCIAGVTHPTSKVHSYNVCPLSS